MRCLIYFNDKEIKINLKKFNYNFVVAYCITSHCAQGASYNEPYTIHKKDKFNKTGWYESLSRSSKLEYINIINVYKEYN
jgi:hypothetical protein